MVETLYHHERTHFLANSSILYSSRMQKRVGLLCVTEHLHVKTTSGLGRLASN
ncbi:hypothetical protein KIN20_029278 [Parelaphostrongylus tenuis]|uniref:Uncharacterized protein n=1 Tax=Parelaphostrongylus tenuis TaxID=148309 RepID=A0AAD5WFV1_PARTN|nr:hypothetical protein KIN20_029278 [Parelaphostrongylus tenuis]